VHLSKDQALGEKTSLFWLFVTVLAVCSAAGIALDPLIIFKGKNMQANWFGDEALPNTYYGKSENGNLKSDLSNEFIKR